MKLIVGLGNPGTAYENTRHNIGFMFIDKVLDKLNINSGKDKFGGIYYETIINNEKIILLKPQQYINLSGQVIRKYIEFFKINIDDIFIIHDDLDLETGKCKLKLAGSSAGHNGLKDIEANLKTQEYRRLKIGISNNKDIETKNYVLGKLTKEESEKLKPIFDVAENIIKDFLELSFSNLMNKYN